nr:hypothetical protein [Mesorhizobium sp. M8A.F.Ca.ET.181.01.1.1]
MTVIGPSGSGKTTLRRWRVPASR